MLRVSRKDLTFGRKCGKLLGYNWKCAMQGLKGRPEASPTIEEVRELTVEEVRATPRAASSVMARVQQLRDSHHMVARLDAMGLTLYEIAEQAGYSITAISILRQDPSYQELRANYREVITEEWRGSVDAYWQNLVGVRNKALRLISDRLDEAKVGEIPLNQLHVIAADGADRTGYPKRKETVNLNLDFADRLDAAVKRSREVRHIDAKPEGSPPLAAPAAGAPGGSARVAEQATEVAQTAVPRSLSFPSELMPQPRLRRA